MLDLRRSPRKGGHRRPAVVSEFDCPMNQNADVGSAEIQPARLHDVEGGGKLIGIHGENSAEN